MAFANCAFDATDERGNLLSNVQVEVRHEASGRLAFCFSDREGAVPLGNPFEVPDGRISFFAPGGAYRIKMTGGGFTRERRFVPIGTAQETDAASLGLTGYTYMLSDETTEPPDPGQIRADDADLSATTKLYVSNELLSGTDISATLLALQPQADNTLHQVIFTDPATQATATFEIAAASAEDGYVVLDIGGFDGDADITISTIRVNFAWAGSKGEQGYKGDKGDKGDKGWAPRLVALADSNRRVLQLSGYVGGEGTPPTDNVGEYLKSDGTYTAVIGEAMDFRGASGAGTVASVIGDTGILVDDTDPTEPVISLDIADQTTAEAGTDNEKAMTALRVKQAIDALTTPFDPSSIYTNIALLALNDAGFEGTVLGFSGMVADAFEDQSGVDGAASTNEVYDAVNGLYRPFSEPNDPVGPSGGSGGGAYNSSTGNNSGIGKTPLGFGGGAGGGAGAANGTGPGVGAPGAPGLIVIQYTPTGGALKTIVLLSGTSWIVPTDWNNASNKVGALGAGGGSGNSNTSLGGGGGQGGCYSEITNLTLTPSAPVPYEVGSAGPIASDGGDTWFNGLDYAGSSVAAKGGKGGVTAGAGGSGNSSAMGIGATKYTGGAGGDATDLGGGGGGGAAGPNGNGASGAPSNGPSGAGGGGGGANGGSQGSGGGGGNGRLGTGGGAAGSPGADGASGTGAGGGGTNPSGGTPQQLSGGAGAQENIWTATAMTENMTLISVGYPSQVQPDKARLVLQIDTPLAVDPGVDFSGEISRDGINWVEAEDLALVTSIGTIKTYASGAIDLSGEPAGVDMHWRLKTLTNKDIAFTGVVENWG